MAMVEELKERKEFRIHLYHYQYFVIIAVVTIYTTTNGVSAFTAHAVNIEAASPANSPAAAITSQLPLVCG